MIAVFFQNYICTQPVSHQAASLSTADQLAMFTETDYKTTVLFYLFPAWSLNKAQVLIYTFFKTYHYIHIY